MAVAYSKPIADYISNADGSTYTHGSSYTPTANSLQVIVVTATATTDVAVMTGGSGWATGGVNPGDGAPELICSATFNSGVSTLYVFAGTAGASPGSWTPVFDCTGDAATGCMMVFSEWTGHNLSDPIRQFKIKDSTTAANPTITLDAATLTTSGGIMAVANTANPAGVTPDGSLFEIADIGHTSPTTGLEVAQFESGATASTYTATRASINHGIVFVEIAIAAGTTYTLTGNTGALTLTGNTGTLKASRKLNGNTGALTLTGNTGALTLQRRITGQTGALTLTGNNATLTASRKLTGQTGALVLTGNTGTLTLTRRLTGQTGALTLTGNTAALTLTRRITGQTGALTLTGNDGELTYTPSAPTYTLTGQTGALILAAGDATLTYTGSGIAPPTFNGDIGPSDYSKTPVHYKTRDELHPARKMPKAARKKIREIVAQTKAPSMEQLKALASAVVPEGGDATFNEMAASLLASLGPLIEKAALEQLKADRVKAQRERERFVAEQISEYLNVLEMDEVLLSYLL